MTLLPMVERELRVAARKSGTYWMRVVAGLVAMIVFAWMIFTLARDNVPSTSHGRFLFRALFAAAFVICLFVGARVTADTLSEEKREGTLGLLFLTDLNGFDVILGKLVAASVNVLYAVLAMIPVIALTTQLGGVTGKELFQASMVLVNTLVLSLAAGIFVSTLSRNERKAMFATVFLILVLAFGPMLLAFVLSMSFPEIFADEDVIVPMLVPSPIYGFAHIFLSPLPVPIFGPRAFWVSFAIVLLLSTGLLSLASLILPRIWQTRDTSSPLGRQRERIEQWSYGAAGQRRAHRTRLLNINPFLWLVGRERWRPYYVWLYVAAVAGTWCWGWFRHGDVMFDRKTLIPGVLLFQVFLKIWVISEACNRLAEDRRSGALELLLSTPLTTHEILRGQWLALRRQFVGPLLVVLLLEYLVLREMFPRELILLNLTMLVADLVTLGWVGMWMGLTSRNTSRAILGAIGRVLVLPWVVLYGGGVALSLVWNWPSGMSPEDWERVQLYAWFVIGMAVNAAFGCFWAWPNLLLNFRSVAVSRFEPGRRRWFAGWNAGGKRPVTQKLSTALN